MSPVWLEAVSRIQGLLAVYFFVLVVQTLLEREIRQAMAKRGSAIWTATSRSLSRAAM